MAGATPAKKRKLEKAEVDPVRTAPLPPSVEAAYKGKCIALRKRLDEVEASNDEARLRISRSRNGIQKARLERAILMDRIRIMMSYKKTDTSEGSPSPPRTPEEKPLRHKKTHGSHRDRHHSDRPSSPADDLADSVPFSNGYQDHYPDEDTHMLDGSPDHGQSRPPRKTLRPLLPQTARSSENSVPSISRSARDAPINTIYRAAPDGSRKADIQDEPSSPPVPKSSRPSNSSEKDFHRSTKKERKASSKVKQQSPKERPQPTELSPASSMYDFTSSRRPPTARSDQPIHPPPIESSRRSPVRIPAREIASEYHQPPPLSSPPSHHAAVSNQQRPPPMDLPPRRLSPIPRYRGGDTNLHADMTQNITSPGSTSGRLPMSSYSSHHSPPPPPPPAQPSASASIPPFSHSPAQLPPMSQLVQPNVPPLPTSQYMYQPNNLPPSTSTLSNMLNPQPQLAPMSQSHTYGQSLSNPIYEHAPMPIVSPRQYPPPIHANPQHYPTNPSPQQQPPPHQYGPSSPQPQNASVRRLLPNKRRNNAFEIYAAKYREELMAKSPRDDVDVGVMASRAWQTLPEDDKQLYQEQFEREKGQGRAGKGRPGSGGPINGIERESGGGSRRSEEEGRERDSESLNGSAIPDVTARMEARPLSSDEYRVAQTLQVMGGHGSENGYEGRNPAGPGPTRGRGEDVEMGDASGDESR